MCSYAYFYFAHHTLNRVFSVSPQVSNSLNSYKTADPTSVDSLTECSSSLE